MHSYALIVEVAKLMLCFDVTAYLIVVSLMFS